MEGSLLDEVTKETKDSVLRKLTNTTKVRVFQRKLYRKAQAEPSFRFYSLYDKTYRMDILTEAYRRVKANGGSDGIDGVKIQDIEAEGIEQYLSALQDELRCRRYKPKPVRRVYIPKPNGKQRPLGIPTVRDRIVQTAFQIVLEPIFDADFCESSHGFRPKRGAHDAVREIYRHLKDGCTEAYDIDLEKYFDTVDHGKLMKLIARRISDGEILRIIRQWLRSGYVEDGKFHKSNRGTPQGGVISPLLANIYLHPVDRAFEINSVGQLVRYADDMVLLCRGSLPEGVSVLEHYMERLGLVLNKDKSKRISFKRGAQIEFLGFKFHHVRNRKTGGKYILVAPSKDSERRCRERIRQHLDYTLPVRTKEQVANVNRFLEGWTNYFRLGNASDSFRRLDNYVNERLRRIIRRRKKKSGHGWNTLTSDYLYGSLGLFYKYHVTRL
jgi:RNA-directed DNA polymerase